MVDIRHSSFLRYIYQCILHSMLHTSQFTKDQLCDSVYMEFYQSQCWCKLKAFTRAAKTKHCGCFLSRWISRCVGSLCHDVVSIYSPYASTSPCRLSWPCHRFCHYSIGNHTKWNARPSEVSKSLIISFNYAIVFDGMKKIIIFFVPVRRLVQLKIQRDWNNITILFSIAFLRIYRCGVQQARPIARTPLFSPFRCSRSCFVFREPPECRPQLLFLSAFGERPRETACKTWSIHLAIFYEISV